MTDQTQDDIIQEDLQNAFEEDSEQGKKVKAMLDARTRIMEGSKREVQTIMDRIKATDLLGAAAVEEIETLKADMKAMQEEAKEREAAGP